MSWKCQPTLFTFNASASCCAPLSPIWLPIDSCWSVYLNEQDGVENCIQAISHICCFMYLTPCNVILNILSFKHFFHFRMHLATSFTLQKRFTDTETLKATFSTLNFCEWDIFRKRKHELEIWFVSLSRTKHRLLSSRIDIIST